MDCSGGFRLSHVVRDTGSISMPMKRVTLALRLFSMYAAVPIPSREESTMRSFGTSMAILTQYVPDWMVETSLCRSSADNDDVLVSDALATWAALGLPCCSADD